MSKQFSKRLVNCSDFFFQKETCEISLKEMNAAAFRTERCLERLLCDESLYLSELDDVQRLMKGRKIEPELNTMCSNLYFLFDCFLLYSF